MPSNQKALPRVIQKEICIYWVAGHAEIDGNEKADQMAKEGATKAGSKEMVDVPIAKCSSSKSGCNYCSIRTAQIFNQ